MSRGPWILLAEEEVNDAKLATHTLADGDLHAQVVPAGDEARTLDCLDSACER